MKFKAGLEVRSFDRGRKFPNDRFDQNLWQRKMRVDFKNFRRDSQGELFPRDSANFQAKQSRVTAGSTGHAVRSGVVLDS
jgi:hypothetical protein